MEHRLKTWPSFFEMVRIGRKRFEVRMDDRGFKVGDLLILQEFDPESGKYTGRELNRGVADVISLSPLYEAVVLTFVWHGDSVESTLRTDLAAAEARLAESEALIVGLRAEVERNKKAATILLAECCESATGDEVEISLAVKNWCDPFAVRNAFSLLCEEGN